MSDTKYDITVVRVGRFRWEAVTRYTKETLYTYIWMYRAHGITRSGAIRKYKRELRRHVRQEKWRANQERLEVEL
jgi:hypothetical protein